MKSAEGNRWRIFALVLVVAGICSIIAGTQAGLLIYSSPETQNLVESGAPYIQKKAVLYSEAVQEKNPAVIEYALLRTALSSPDGSTLQYVCDIWDDTSRNWKVVSDPPGPEYISSSLESIRADLRGDCDDYSVLISGLCSAVGADMRIVNVAGTGGNPGHAYPEYRLGDNKAAVLDQCRYISARYDCEKVYYSTSTENGKTIYWLNLDWAVGRSPDAGYYLYGDSRGYHELVHPGQSYAGLKGSAEFFYPDGSYSGGLPGYGYYAQDIFGKEALNAI